MAYLSISVPGDGTKVRKLIGLGRSEVAKIRVDTPDIEYPAALISIRGHDEPKAYVHPGVFNACLFLTFDDIDTLRGEMAFAHEIPMSDADADRICRFLLANWKHAHTIVCQCEAGMSRSIGLMAALVLRLGGSDDAIYARKWPPNSHVKTMMMRRFKLCKTCGLDCGHLSTCEAHYDPSCCSGCKG